MNNSPPTNPVYISLLLIPIFMIILPFLWQFYRILFLHCYLSNIIFAFITYLCIHFSDIEINTIKSHSLLNLSSPVVDDIYCSRVCLCARVSGCVWRERTARNFTVSLLRVGLTVGCFVFSLSLSLLPSSELSGEVKLLQ